MKTYWILFKSSNGDGTFNAGVCDTSNVSDNTDVGQSGGDITPAPCNNIRDELAWNMPSESSLLMSSSNLFHNFDETDGIPQVDHRLVAWDVDVLQSLIKKIIAMRGTNNTPIPDSLDVQSKSEPGKTVLDEVREFITLPNKPATYTQDPTTIELDPKVVAQLTEFVTAIATMYNDNPFHAFSHACHVLQSVIKLLARVVTPDSGTGKEQLTEVKLHQYTYGIASDPLVQFACAFTALIHDLDHPGVPNGQLVKEETDLAVLYKNKSVAEQNSVDLAWALFMEPRFKDLRAAIYDTKEEMDRFRQLVVNAVMATDVMDKELNALRRIRWDKAFAIADYDIALVDDDQQREHANRKATIVIEHLIQSSDIAHTMQHWHVYVKWVSSKTRMPSKRCRCVHLCSTLFRLLLSLQNERLFNEMYRAYVSGRAEKNPAEFWYDGEIGFFKFYVIPLAKKLKDCGVFGVASDEYLTYATLNLKEWELKGKDMVQQYLEVYDVDSSSDGDDSVIEA